MEAKWNRLADVIFIGFLVLCFTAGAGGIYYHSHRLQAQAIEAHRQFVSLDNRYSTDLVIQTANTVGLTLNTLLEAGYDSYSTAEWESRLQDALRHAPHLRSLSLLNEAGRVVASSNPANVGTVVDQTAFLPRINAWESVLQVGPALAGRDLANGVRIKSEADAAPPLSFFPLALGLAKGEGSRLTLVAVVNVDYLLNRLNGRDNSFPRWVDVVRYDGTLLCSTRESARSPAVLDANRGLAGRWQAGQEVGSLDEDMGAEGGMISAFRSDRVLPLAVVTRIDADHAVAEARKEGRQQILTLMPLLLLSIAVILVAYLLFRRATLRRMDDQVRELERVTSLLDALPAGILLFGADGRVATSNRSWREIAREGTLPLPAEAPHLHYAELATALNRDGSAFGSALETGITGVLSGKEEAFAGECLLHGPQGPRWFQVFVRPFMRSRQPGAVLMLLDITERRMAEAALRDSEERYRLTVAAVRDGLWELDMGTGQGRWDARCFEMLGYRPDAFEITRPSWTELIHPEDFASLRHQMAHNLAAGTPFQYEMRLRTAAATWRWIEVRGQTAETNPRGRPRRIVGTHTDITARKESEARLRLLETALAAAANAVVITDTEAIIEWVNPAFAQLTGYSREETIGRRPRELIKSGLQPVELYQALWNTILAGRVWRGEVINKRKDGSLYAEALTITPVKDEHGALTHFVAIKEDITERQRQEKELRRLATTDPLTGVRNRRAFLTQLEQELVRHGRYCRPAALLMLDIDHFKLVNDRYGHAAGDAVLVAFTSTVQSCLRAADCIGRLGGEEFAVLLADTDQAGARNLAQRLCEAVADTSIPVAEGELKITVSIGLTTLSTLDTGIESVLARADDALYQAKEQGRNRIDEILPV